MLGNVMGTKKKPAPSPPPPPKELGN